MKIIWYNTHTAKYKAGSADEFQLIMERSQAHEILPLEKFHNEPDRIILKIVQELNKCNQIDLKANR